MQYLILVSKYIWDIKWLPFKINHKLNNELNNTYKI